MCWFPFLSPSSSRKHHHSSLSSPLLAPRPAMSSRHHHPYHPLSSHPPATSDTSLTHHAGYRVRRIGHESSGGKRKTKQRDGVLSGHGVKRAPPRAWDDWDAAALQRRGRVRLESQYGYQQQHPPPHRHHHYGGYHQHHHHHPTAQTATTTPIAAAGRQRANSSARRSSHPHPHTQARPLINVGHNHTHHGNSFAARAAATPHAGLNDVLRAAMYQPDAAYATRPAVPVAGRRRGGGFGGGYGRGIGAGAGAAGGTGWGLESWM
ncbi:hypothetical protein HDK77DRAFT_510374 [Phyllosticta capitalensis]